MSRPRFLKSSVYCAKTLLYGKLAPVFRGSDNVYNDCLRPTSIVSLGGLPNESGRAPESGIDPHALEQF